MVWDEKFALTDGSNPISSQIFRNILNTSSRSMKH